MYHRPGSEREAVSQPLLVFHHLIPGFVQSSDVKNWSTTSSVTRGNEERTLGAFRWCQRSPHCHDIASLRSDVQHDLHRNGPESLPCSDVQTDRLSPAILLRHSSGPKDPLSPRRRPLRTGIEAHGKSTDGGWVSFRFGRLRGDVAFAELPNPGTFEDVRFLEDEDPSTISSG